MLEPALPPPCCSIDRLFDRPTVRLFDSRRCRHLTDFVAVSAPTITVCSISQLTSLSADDVFNKLRFLLYVVAGLFGFMIMGAGIGLAIDTNSARKNMRAMRRPEMGFKELERRSARRRFTDTRETVWIWSLWQARERTSERARASCTPECCDVADWALLGRAQAQLIFGKAHLELTLVCYSLDLCAGAAGR